MKYVTFAIMAVLIFGVAAAPVFSNGMVFAQTEREVAIEKKEATAAKKEASTKKHTVAQKIQEQRRAALEERRAELEEKRDTQQEKRDTQQERRAELEEKRDTQQEKRDTQQERRTVAQELKETRHAALKEKKRLLQEKLDEEERIDRERMQERLDNMGNRSPMTDAINRLNQANSDCGPGTIFDDASNSCVLDLVDFNNPSTETTTTPISIPPPEVEPTPILDNTGTYFDTLREVISEQKRSQDNLFRQITMLLNLLDSMCEDKVLVAGVSDGKLRCIDPDKAFNMHSRGLVTLVE